MHVETFRTFTARRTDGLKYIYIYIKREREKICAIEQTNYNIILYSILLHCVQTWCGQIQRTLLDGPSAPEEQASAAQEVCFSNGARV